MTQKLSVLMSVYYKEKPQYLTDCLDSLLAQTRPADEWVVVEDGPLTAELYQVLNNYQQKYPQLIKRVPLAKNQGLGLALREGILHCSYELVARMDTDDVSVPERFEKQLAAFDKKPSPDICGSHIIEFENSPEHILSIRKVPLSHDEIAQYQKTRSAFNHVSVIFKKSAVLKAGNYQDAPLMEDDLLWVNMLRSGAKCINLDENLVYVRTGADMIARRGGWDYFKKYKAGRKQILETGYISYWDYYKTLVIQLVVALVPRQVRLFVFTHLLRNK